MSITDLIDHAIDDWEESVDAMRWAPRHPDDGREMRREMWRRKGRLRSGNYEEWFGAARASIRLPFDISQLFPPLMGVSSYRVWFDEASLYWEERVVYWGERAPST